MYIYVHVHVYTCIIMYMYTLTGVRWVNWIPLRTLTSSPSIAKTKLSSTPINNLWTLDITHWGGWEREREREREREGGRERGPANQPENLSNDIGLCHGNLCSRTVKRVYTLFMKLPAEITWPDQVTETGSFYTWGTWSGTKTGFSQKYVHIHTYILYSAIVSKVFNFANLEAFENFFNKIVGMNIDWAVACSQITSTKSAIAEKLDSPNLSAIH